MPILNSNHQNPGAEASFLLWKELFSPGTAILTEDREETATAPGGITPERTTSTRRTGVAQPRTKVIPGTPSPRKEYPNKQPTTPSTTAPTDARPNNNYGSNTPTLSLTRPRIKLDPFQEQIYYSLIPVDNTIETEYHPYQSAGNDADGVHRIPITTSSVLGESGSGLTTMLAKKAYENYQDGRPTIILTHREHLFHKLAQSIIDFADPSHRASLLSNIEVISADVDLMRIDPNKKIYIISADKLKNYLKKNPSYRQLTYPAMTRGGQTWGANLEHARLADILPLNKIREVLVDEVNRYTGTTDEGFTKVLTSLLQETSTDPGKDPVHLFGTTATPYAREPDKSPSDRYRLLEFDNLFPPLSRQTTPSATELIEDHKFYKKPIIDQMKLDDAMEHQMLHADAGNRLLDADTGSINANLVDLYQAEATRNPNKKWHIIANSTKHADQLCALFNLEGINAKVATSQTKGYFRRIADDENQEQRGVITLNDANKTTLKKETQDVATIINDYENGNCNVIIDLDNHSCIHSTKTDKVVVLNLAGTDSRTKHYLGEAVKDKQGGLNQSIEYLFLRADIANSFSGLINGSNIALSPIPKHQSEAHRSTEADALRTQTSISVERINTIEFNRLWLNNGLRTVLNQKYPALELSQALENLTHDFYTHRHKTDKTQEELKGIISGTDKNSEVFLELINFLERDLQQYFQSEFNQGNINVQQELIARVPHLTSVPDEVSAERILAKTYETMTLHSDSFETNAKWLARLDGALGLNQSDTGAARENKRNKFFTTIIAKKFGLEFFENNAFLQKAIKVFTGAEVDYKLFGLLVNILSSDGPTVMGGTGFSFDDIRKDFPNLLGTQRQVPFSVLQKKILAKYPEGPPHDQSLNRFFKEQLYDDFALDFGTLINSTTNHTRNTDQELISGSVQDQIYNFLEAEYKGQADHNLSTESGLQLDSKEHGIEIKLKTQEHFNTVTKEILFNQLLAKIWGQGRSVRINNDDFIFNMNADTLSLDKREGSSLEDQIDLNKVNPDWLLAFDHQVNPGHYRIDIKKRLAYITANFLAHKHGIEAEITKAANTETLGGSEYFVTGSTRSRHSIIDGEINPYKISLSRDLNANEQRELQVLLGAIPVSELTEADKSLAREFAEFHKIKISELLPRFSDRLGVNNLDEAKIIIKGQLKTITDTNQEWLNVFGSSEDRLNLLAKFFFNDEKKKLTLSSVRDLKISLSILSGKINRDSADRHHDFNRELVAFANAEGAKLNLEELVIKFRQIIGIQTAPELFAVMRQAEFVNLTDNKDPLNPNKYPHYTTKGAESFVTELAKKLGKTPSELFSLAGLNEPNNFYKEPIDLFNAHLNTKLEFNPELNDRITIELKELCSKNANSIKSRELLVKAYGDNYKPSSIFILPENNNPDHPRINIQLRANEISFFEEHKKPDFGKSNETQWKKQDFQTYRYSDDKWQLVEEENDVNSKFYRVSSAIQTALKEQGSKLTPSWLAHLGISKDSQPSDPNFQKLVLAIDSFIRFMTNNEQTIKTKITKDNDIFNLYIQTLLGRQDIFNDSRKQACKQAIRDFIEYINSNSDLNLAPIELQQVIKETPKLTGVQNYNELKSTLDHHFKDYIIFQNSISENGKDQSPASYLKFLSSFTATPAETLLTFPELQKEYDRYLLGIDQLQLPEFIKDDFVNDNNSKRELLSTILIRKLFPLANQNTYYLWEDRAKSAGKKDILMNLIFTNNKLQFDAFYETNNQAQKLFTHKTLDWNYSTQEWTELVLNENQLKTRFALMKLFNTHRLNTLSLELNDAYDACLCHDQEYDYLFVKVSNLMADFLVTQNPELFSKGSEELLANRLAALYGAPEFKDIALVNQFIDFAETKHPGFKDIRTNPKFKDIFSEPSIGIKPELSPAEAAIKAIREKITPAQASQLFNGGSDKKLALEELIKLAVAQGCPQVTVAELQTALGIPDNEGFREQLRPAFAITSILSQDKDLETSGEDLALLRDAIKNIPIGFPDFMLEKYRATACFQKLFPNQHFNFIATRSFTNLDPLDLKDATTGENLNSNTHLKFEYDGNNLVFLSYISDPEQTMRILPDRSREVTTDIKTKILSSLAYDESTGLWTPITGDSKTQPLIKTKEDISRIFRTVFTEADLHRLEKTIYTNLGEENYTKTFYNYLLTLFGVTANELDKILNPSGNPLEHYKDGLKNLFGRSATDEEIEAVISSVDATSEYERMLLNFINILRTAYPNSLRPNRLPLIKSVSQEITLSGNTVDMIVNLVAEKISRFNTERQEWQANKTLAKVDKAFYEFIKTIPEASSLTEYTSFLLHTVFPWVRNLNHDLLSSRISELVEQFMQAHYPEAFADDALFNKVLASVLNPQTHDEILSNFIDFVSIRFPDFKEASKLDLSTQTIAPTPPQPQSTEERMIDYIKKTFSVNDIIGLFNTYKKSETVIEFLWSAAENGLGLNQFSPKKLYEALKVPPNIAEHLKIPFNSLTTAINPRLLGLNSEASSAIKAALRAFSATQPNATAQKIHHEFKALNTLRKLFPSLIPELKKSNLHLLIEIKIPDESILQGKKFFINYDGKDLSLLKQDSSTSALTNLLTIYLRSDGSWQYTNP